MKPFIGAVVQTASIAFDPVRTVEKLGDFASMDFGHGLQVGQVVDRAGMLDQREAFTVECAAALARVGYQDFGGLEGDEVLLVRVGVEVRAPLGALGIADRGAHIGHAGSNSSVSIVGRIAS